MKISKLLKYTTCGLAVASLAATSLTVINSPFSSTNDIAKYALVDNSKQVVLNTEIVALADYPQHILVGEWRSLVDDGFGDVDPVKLTEFLDLSSVPTDATYKISNYSPNLVSGVLNFDISSSKYYLNDTIVNSESTAFPITLNLTSQITRFETRTDYSPLLVNKIASQLFYENNTVNMKNFRKYVNVFAPVQGAILYLVPDSLKTYTNTGVAEFSVFYDKYYDANGIEKSQTSTTITEKYDVSLNLLPLPTVITSNKTYAKDLRVDELLPLITNNDNELINSSVYSKYLTVENIPTGAVLKVVNVSTRDYTLGILSFDIEASAYIDANSVPSINGIFPISLNLLPKFNPTTIVLKPAGSYDDTIRVDRLIPLFVNEMNDNQEGVVTNLTELLKFVDIGSLPPNTILSIVDVNRVDATGMLDFSIEANQYYDADSNLITTPFKFPISIQLQPKYQPSVITAKLPEDITEFVRVDQFLSKFCDLNTGVITDLNYLEKFVNISGNFGPTNEFTVDLNSVVIENLQGTISFKIGASAYYDANSDLQHNGVFPIALVLQGVYPPTYAKPLNNYSKDLTISEFKAAIPTEQTQLRAFLTKFIDGINTFPAAAAISIVWDSTLEDPLTGSLGFTLETTSYYDENSDLINTTKAFPINLVIRPNDTLPDETVVVLLPETPPFKSLKDLLDAILKDSTVDYANFTQYFDITTVPTGADIEIIYNPEDLNNPNFIRFVVRVTEYYDGEGQKIKSQKDFPFEIDLKPVPPVPVNTCQWWWWLLAGILLLIILTIIVYMSLKKRQTTYSVALARIKNSRRLK